MALVNAEVQAFLDDHEYTQENIRRYELIFGKKYVSTGGERSTAEFLEKIDLHENDYVLDVGCGLGGSAFYMAKKYGARVLGVDISTQMVSRAKASAIEDMNEKIKSKVTFEVQDVTRKEFMPLTFDVIFCKESSIYCENKIELFTNYLHWLKPGGKLLIVDYCLGPAMKMRGEAYERFQTYLNQKHYHMLSREETQKVLTKVGFQILENEDMTERGITYLKDELARLEKQREDTIAQLEGTKESRVRQYEEMVTDLKFKIRCSTLGEETWGLIIARKP